MVCSRSSDASGNTLGNVTRRATEKHYVLLRHARMENSLAQSLKIGKGDLFEQQISFGILLAGPVKKLEIRINADDSHLRANYAQVLVQRCSWLADYIANLRVGSSNDGPLCLERVALPQSREIDRGFFLLQMGEKVLVESCSKVSDYASGEEHVLASERHPRIQ